MKEHESKENEDDFEEHVVPKDGSCEDEEIVPDVAQSTLAIVSCMFFSHLRMMISTRLIFFSYLQLQYALL